MRIKWDENQVEEVMQANAILRHAGMSDQQIGRQLDVAGVVLRRHEIPNLICPLTLDMIRRLH